MTDRVDAPMYRVQPAALYSVPDAARRKAELNQLPYGDHPVLSRCKSRKLHIDGGVCRLASHIPTEVDTPPEFAPS